MRSSNIKSAPLQRATVMLITSNEVNIQLLQSAFPPIILSLNAAPEYSYSRLSEHQSNIRKLNGVDDDDVRLATITRNAPQTSVLQSVSLNISITIF